MPSPDRSASRRGGGSRTGRRRRSVASAWPAARARPVRPAPPSPAGARSVAAVPARCARSWQPVPAAHAARTAATPAAPRRHCAAAWPGGLERGQVVHCLLVLTLGLVAGHGGCRRWARVAKPSRSSFSASDRWRLRPSRTSRRTSTACSPGAARSRPGPAARSAIGVVLRARRWPARGRHWPQLRGRDHAAGVQRQHCGDHWTGAPVALGERQRRIDAEGFSHRRQ